MLVSLGFILEMKYIYIYKNSKFLLNNTLTFLCMQMCHNTALGQCKLIGSQTDL